MKKKTDNFETMCKEICKYIEFKDGKCLVIGGIRIRHRPPLKYNFTLEIDFNGRPPKKFNP